MALAYRTGTFAAATSPGDQVVDTGSGVDMKLLILYATLQAGTGFAAGESGFVSFSQSSTARICSAWASDDNVATNNAACSFQAETVRMFSNGTPTVDAVANFVSFGTGANAGKFTINWSDAPASAWTIHYICLGGTDLTDVVITQHAASLATGNIDYTTVGVQGDCVMFLGIANTALSSSLTGVRGVALGAATSSSARASFWGGGRDARTAAAYSKHVQSGAHCLVFSVANGNAHDADADFVQFLSNGFRLNWTNLAAGAYLFYSIVLKGGSYDVSLFNSPTATGNQFIPSGHLPAGVFFLGTGQTTADLTLGSERHMCFGGMGNPTLAGSSVWSSEDDVINTDANKYNSVTNCITVATNPSTLAAQASPVSLDANGYTINWGTAPATARKFIGVTFGDAPVAGAWKFVQTRSTIDDVATSTTIAATFVANVTAGNLIVVHVGHESASGTTVTVADTLSNTYTEVNSAFDSVNGQKGWMFYAKNITGGACTVTATISVTETARRIIIDEYSGLDTTAPLDASAVQYESAPGTGTDAVNSTAFTTNAANDLVVGATQNTSQATPGSGVITEGTNFKMRGSAGTSICKTESRNLASAGSVDATFTHSSAQAHITHGAAFKEASTGVTGTATIATVKFAGLASSASLTAESGTVQIALVKLSALNVTADNTVESGTVQIASVKFQVNTASAVSGVTGTAQIASIKLIGLAATSANTVESGTAQIASIRFQANQASASLTVESGTAQIASIRFNALNATSANTVESGTVQIAPIKLIGLDATSANTVESGTAQIASIKLIGLAATSANTVESGTVQLALIKFIALNASASIANAGNCLIASIKLIGLDATATNTVESGTVQIASVKFQANQASASNTVESGTVQIASIKLIGLDASASSVVESGTVQIASIKFSALNASASIANAGNCLIASVRFQANQASAALTVESGTVQIASIRLIGLDATSANTVESGTVQIAPIRFNALDASASIGNAGNCLVASIRLIALNATSANTVESGTVQLASVELISNVASASVISEVAELTIALFSFKVFPASAQLEVKATAQIAKIAFKALDASVGGLVLYIDNTVYIDNSIESEVGINQTIDDIITVI